MPLETFSAIGEWRLRERDTGVTVDPTGEMAGTGRPVTGPDDLRQALADDPEQFVQTMTEKLMVFALGRPLEYYDMPTVRAVVDQVEAADYRFEAMLRGIVQSAPFRMQEQAPAAAATTARLAELPGQ
jgi:hypothetical protein